MDILGKSLISNHSYDFCGEKVVITLVLEGNLGSNENNGGICAFGRGRLEFQITISQIFRGGNSGRVQVRVGGFGFSGWRVRKAQPKLNLFKSSGQLCQP